ncbi:hypothetical protein RN001_014802 [Aquatica leii]|uniref:DNA replication ATP-dependent helicase/nuclease n=1 Tax=Aquatica leii TaxID=1421715 RepID=A0AAN7SKS1_9COLE|nr:hypothetical protein RN001_014802 [Aquatica leii]
MKKSAKTKKKSNGSQKISDYFKKVTDNQPNRPSTTNEILSLRTNKEVILVVDSEDETDNATALNNKRKRLNGDITPSKILEPITNLPQCSTTNEITPEKLLKRVKENSCSPDIIPCSLNTIEQRKCNQSIKDKLGRIRCKSREKLFDDTVIVGDTPEKPTVNRRQCKSSEKKTPTKLFSKSPKSLDKFNVEIIENFVRVTPSKSNHELSPVTSPLLEQIQQMNERTPTKSPQKKLESVLKAKLRLEFDDGTSSMLDDGWNDEFLETFEFIHTLDLTESQHCKIDKVKGEGNIITLILKSSKDGTTAECDVEGFWTNLTLRLNDTIYISATYSNERGKWIVNNTHGLIVYQPDLLVSTTSVVGSQFCLRRSVLKEKYYGFEPSNQIMIVGVLVHKLLQEVLRQNIRLNSEIEVMAKKLMLDKDTVWMCYESDLSLETILKELMVFVPRIESFVKQYVCKDGNGISQRDNWQGKIVEVQDIEENIWCHELGVKGKVDVSVRSSVATMPLEVKTGRVSMSLEHRGQVMFYIMMMQKLGYSVSSGLLLYLREGVLREVPITPQEKRDLTMLRNELAYFLTRNPKFNGERLEWELPKPINHHNACSKCPYSTICCTFLKYHDTDLNKNPLQNLQNEVLSHLEPVHIDYFMKWSALLSLESSCGDKTKQLHEIYTLPPETREKNGQCVSGVVVKEVTDCGGLYQHSFVKLSGTDNFTMQSSGIGVGNYVVVSTDRRPAVAAGFATDMDTHMITINLDRNLNNNYSNQTFHLDTYASSVSQGFNMTNLSLLLEASDQAARLRKFIIERQPPTFKNNLPKAVATKGTSILRKLNKMQQKAILKSLSTNDYLLIKGMPGTGKTDTIVSLIELLVELNKSVLITSHTHSAIDNVCIRLVDRGVGVLRLGSDSKIHPKLRMYSENTLTKHCQTPEQLEKVYNGAKVLAVTCLGSGHSVLSKRVTDVCIVDESTQVLQCSVFRALYTASKFILIGDPDQLPPIVRNPEAVARGLSESLFERLDSPNSTVILRLNYRMNKPITDMANALTYQGQLLTGNDIVANATLKLPDAEAFFKLYKEQQWIVDSLDQSLSASIRILDTGSVYERLGNDSTTPEENRCTNPFEAAILIKLIDALLVAGVSNEAIGVIAPYRAQVSRLSIALKDRNIETSTVDQFQGRDKEIIFYSCTRSGQRNSHVDSRAEILDDKRRLTVAITRAKHKFILIGDLSSVRQYYPFQRLLDSLHEQCFIRLTDGELGFSWDDVMRLV